MMLGIDPGTRVMGFSIMQIKKDGKIHLKEAGCLLLPEKDPLQRRLHKIYAFLEQKITENNIKTISLETPFLGKNAQNFLKLGYVRGIIYLVADQHNISLKEYAPREIKKAVTGSGGAEKDQVARVIKLLFPEISNIIVRHDITDAVAVSFCGITAEYNR